MARIVAGFATSFSPQLHVPPEVWASMGERDKSAAHLNGPDGQDHSYDELVATAGAGVAAAVAPAEMAARHARCQQHIASIGKALRDTALDALVVFADDENYLFSEHMRPSCMLYFGETVPYLPRKIAENAPAATKAGAWAYGTETLELPGAHELGHHIMWHFSLESQINIAHSRYLLEGQSIGHPFGFTQTRLLEGKQVPLLPVIFNASYPPNVPTPKRFYEIGRGIADAVASFPQDIRVGVLAVGGFSHPVVDEEMDRRVLDIIDRKDVAAIGALPKARFKGGNGQELVWLAAAGALHDQQMHLIDYVPAYRSAGGTGCGMAFATWQ